MLSACLTMLSTGSLVIAYGSCSASMLLVNKWALLHFPLPAMLTFLQCAATALIVQLVRATGALSIESVEWRTVRDFITVPVLFALALYSSSQLLHFGDAGLQILIRTTTPAAVCILDFLFMGYELPSRRSAMALVGLVVGAACYFRVETAITPAAIFWGAFYFVSISVEMVWVKHVLNRVRMSTWTRVAITNFVTAIFMTPFTLVNPERERLVDRLTLVTPLSRVAVMSVAISCVAGFALSMSGFKLRETVSATTFTFVGVVCKFATVLVNQLIWVHHGSSFGAIVLCCSILLSTIYVAPKKRELVKVALENSDEGLEGAPEEDASHDVEEEAGQETSSLVMKPVARP